MTTDANYARAICRETRRRPIVPRPHASAPSRPHLRRRKKANRSGREKGYAGTTAQDIASVSDANLRSIGYHFGSTRELLNAAISLNFRLWLEPLIEAAADETHPLPSGFESG